MEIELIDLRAAADRARLLEADGAKRGDAEHRPVFGGGPGDRALALMMEQPLQGGRRAVDRHRQLLAHDRHRHVDLAHPAQHVGNQVASLEAFGVAAIGDLVVGSTVDIVEDRPRQPPLRHAAEVGKIVTVAEPHHRIPNAMSLAILSPLVLRGIPTTWRRANGLVRPRRQRPLRRRQCPLQQAKRAPSGALA